MPDLLTGLSPASAVDLRQKPAWLSAALSRARRPETWFLATTMAFGLLVVAVRRHEIWATLKGLFLPPTSGSSALSLLCAGLIATLWMGYERRRRGRPFNPRLLARALFPRWLLRSASTRADLGFFLLNNFAAFGMISWAMISAAGISHWAHAGLSAAFGPATHPPMDPRVAEALQTVAIFVAYEFGYWVDHYLSHEVPALWAFHRVHHTAETLTPATLFRVHPVDSLVFYNISMLCMGLTNGAVAYLTGVQGQDFTLGGTNVILIPFYYLIGHLQHSHVWIPFRGFWGRLLCSPAHHQIHHSTDPAHFGKNLGNILAVWDWLFGTLRMPARTREKLVFGVEPGHESPHTVTGGLITPFVHCVNSLKTMVHGAPRAE